MKYLLSGITIILMACGSGKTETLLKNKKWKVYDVTIPAKDGYNAVQLTQAKDLKSGYYSDAYYQFFDNGLFIATIAGKPDSGKYQLLSNGSIISVTAANGDRKVEHLVEVVKLSDELFDMKVESGDYHFILRTRKQ
ncbi:hypothetical protein GFS24_00890 [Chitinophaga sp. SYP-B3965]|uniref:hypothetical protein n=1 Tax=Chitinophaga sp. SYP-B3965 TaxID=2663120 RepID=UPI00129A0337|nr:hypothetical protein [Chitinophaga sp. SYP-B3965]MRG43646.1 hypothetical protein [Chitinophaga sp. SYP-B3965]